MSEEGESPPAYAPRGSNATIYILLVGLTGSGKSTFINLASGSDLRASNTLDSCTQIVEAAPEFDFEGRRICFIDTPGFDDTDRSEVEILKLITNFLETQYKEKILLHGIIYLQRITDNRIGGVSTRTLRMFKKLCGSDSLKNMTIVTNMWSKDVSQEESRERQLREDPRFFKPFMDNHATMVRHHNTIESAHSIIRQICTHVPSALDIQRETVDLSKVLPDTSAGIILHSDLLAPTQKMHELVSGLQSRIKAARIEGDGVKAEEFRKELSEIAPDLIRLYNELKNLESYKGKEIDVMQVWNKMDQRAQTIAILKRTFGVENDRELNDFWAALGDTITFFKTIYGQIEEFPLPHSVEEQLFRDSGALTTDVHVREKFDRWLLDHAKDIAAIRVKVRTLVAQKARGSQQPKSILSRVGNRIRTRLEESRTLKRIRILRG